MIVFLAPHHDDETLFGAFTLLAERPLVVVVYDGGPERELESQAAMSVLGCELEHWRLPPADPLTAIPPIRELDAAVVYAPRPEQAGGQPEHDVIGDIAAAGRWELRSYLTYTDAGKATDGVEVPYRPEWVPLKLRALACYPSQAGHPSHAAHFLRDQTEYLAA